MVSSPLDRSGAAESERGDTRQKQILLRFFVATRPQGFQTEPQRGKIDGSISGRGVGYLIDEARARPPGDSVLGPARGRILWKAGRPSYKPSAGGSGGGFLGSYLDARGLAAASECLPEPDLALGCRVREDLASFVAEEGAESVVFGGSAEGRFRS